ncbi:MAG: ATP-binding protein, partial [Vicinamibacterales bacterium]
DHRPGRYLLTGSVTDDLRSSTWPGTGRVVRLAMYGMTIAEQLDRVRSVPLLDRLVRETPLAVPADSPDIRGYVELGMRSGFPRAALWLSGNARSQWIEGYLEQLLTRDAMELRGLRHPERLRRYFEALALNTAGVVDDRTLYASAGIDRKTALAYERLLINLSSWNGCRRGVPIA